MKSNSFFPRDPGGLRWSDHYLMADAIYAAYTCGGARPKVERAAPDPLPEAEKPPARVHRKPGLDGKRIA